MKREELEALGLEKNAIDKIMDMNGNDVNAAKAQLETEKTRADNAETQIKDRDKDIAELKKTAGKDTELEGKLATLQEKYNNDTQAYKQQLETVKRDHALEQAIREAGGKNPKAVRGFLDLEKIKLKADGSLEALDLKTIKESDPYLFDEEDDEDEPKITFKGYNPASSSSRTTENDSFQSQLEALFKEG